ncbi:uncharacterized protein LOC114366301 [Ostrinia furnacalis]|uniref:uncharacterized protein LOC114366301 n=1 Tax=Ostrinia furnacalis TaxID=93504 RepID=UPI001040941A|nr:uncharacterized protein LOC114366301 [Ostrinia furnacalis]
MSLTILLSIFLNFNLIYATYLNAESNFLRPQLERNNIINKGVWVRDPKDRLFEKSNAGEFIFRANSLDVDSLLQNNFDAFGDNGMQDSPGISSYVERTKRSANNERKRILRESMKECKGDKDCVLHNIDDKFVKSKLISKLKPTSVFNDYPYEVAILLEDNKLDDNSSNNIKRVKESTDDNSVIPLYTNKESPQVNIESLVKTESKVETAINNTITPKRSMKNEYESEVIKKIEINEEIDSDNSTKVDRNIFDKEERVWHQNMPMSDANAYKILPKYPSSKNKPINERGLIKVLSMLTKTFKKIMRQHSDIKKIHSKLHLINDEVKRNIADMNKKFKDIEEKYSHIVTLSDKMKIFETSMNLKEEYFKVKDTEMSKNLLEFENQQKKFLTQQRQFYNIQKLMLAQNEKINMKQNLIAKTQSEISHRQNNFARILKKAKQIYIDNKQTSKISTTTKPNVINDTDEPARITHTTTQAPIATESIKINLFSIPSLNKLVNQDTLLLKDKDEQPVDDLVYKYYFNNTFIDNLMKSKVLSTFMTTAENAEIARNAKNKRNKDELETTILLPINKIENGGALNRERRWIHHMSKAKLKKISRGKSSITNSDIKDEKPLKTRAERNASNNGIKTTKLFAKDKANPYQIMAKNFCTEIGQNKNVQMLSWCIEKALRRLQYMDFPAPAPPPENTKVTTQQVTTAATTKILPLPKSSKGSSAVPRVFTSTPSLPTSVTTSKPLANSNLIYFPDLKPDTEGNVYYDGSLHSSDIVGLGMPDSEGLSDIMPGFESNSRIDVDPYVFDLQARRRETVRRINENIMKKVMYG